MLGQTKVKHQREILAKYFQIILCSLLFFFLSFYYFVFTSFFFFFLLFCFYKFCFSFYYYYYFNAPPPSYYRTHYHRSIFQRCKCIMYRFRLTGLSQESFFVNVFLHLRGCCGALAVATSFFARPKLMLP